jgi:CheY-like chemotaxis protein
MARNSDKSRAGRHVRDNVRVKKDGELATNMLNQVNRFMTNESLPSAKQTRCLKILCIDDDAQILEMLKACLAQYGHQVRMASGGNRGINLFTAAMQQSEPYDAVITDLRMPDVNGCDVAHAIKIESPSTPVILLTAWGATVKDDAAIVSIVDAVLSKPPRIVELNDLLLRLAG